MKPETSSGGGGGERPRHSSHNNSTYNRDKVRSHSSAPFFASSVYRSMSAPGLDTMEPERVVVRAYGNVAPPSPQNRSLLPAHSPPQIVPTAGILEGRDVSVSGRKRPGRKTRRPDVYGGLSPENGITTSFQIGRFSCTPFALLDFVDRFKSSKLKVSSLHVSLLS